MDDLRLEPINPRELTSYLSWFDSRGTTEVIANNIADEGSGVGNSLAWTGVLDNKVVAVACFLEDGDVSSIYLAVDPSMRRHHVGTKLLELILDKDIFKDSLTIRVNIAFDNTAAQKMVANNGFVNTGQTVDGLMVFERKA